MPSRKERKPPSSHGEENCVRKLTRDKNPALGLGHHRDKGLAATTWGLFPQPSSSLHGMPILAPQTPRPWFPPYTHTPSRQAGAFQSKCWTQRTRQLGSGQGDKVVGQSRCQPRYPVLHGCWSPQIPGWLGSWHLRVFSLPTSEGQ